MLGEDPRNSSESAHASDPAKRDTERTGGDALGVRRASKINLIRRHAKRHDKIGQVFVLVDSRSLLHRSNHVITNIQDLDLRNDSYRE